MYRNTDASPLIKVLVCGDRHWKDQIFIDKVLDVMKDQIGTIIEGEANGADKMGRVWAEKNDKRVEPYPANWEKFGKAAGPIRNKQMLDEGKPDMVIAFHDDLENSRGTKNMVEQSRKRGITVVTVNHSKEHKK
jgi:homoserine dehydrogenase